MGKDSANFILVKGAVCEIGKLGSNAPFFDADHIDMVHFGFYSGVFWFIKA